MSKRIVSLAVFRHRRSANAGLYKGLFYPHHLPGLLRAYLNLLPGWTIRIHHDDTVNRGRHAATCHALEALGDVEMVWRPQDTLCGSMLWRMLPLWDLDCDAFIARDLESCPTPREAHLVNEWLETGKALHCIHDSASHAGPGSSGPMMGGMIGIRPALARQRIGGLSLPLRQPRSGNIDMEVQGADQHWMNAHLWPNLKGSALLHKRVECYSAPTEQGVERRDAMVKDPTWFNNNLRGHWTNSGELPEAKGDQHLRTLWGIGTPEDPWTREIGDGRRKELTEQANKLGLHIGLVFDAPRATTWWDAHGHPDVIKKMDAVATLLGSREEFNARVDQMPTERHLVDTWMQESWCRVTEREVRADRVLLASNHSTNYCFFLPIAACFWRVVAGRHASAILVCENSPDEWRNGYRNVVYRALRSLGVEVHFVKCPPGYGSSTGAQVARLLGGALPIDPETSVITSDADMLPLSKQFFALTPGETVNLYCANAYPQRDRAHFPICYIEAKARIWREIIPTVGRVEPAGWEDDVERHMSGSIAAIFSAGLAPHDGGNSWCYDERFVSERIAASRFMQNACKINRPGADPPSDRLDRDQRFYPSHWNNLTRDGLAKYVDCHLMRPAHTDEAWHYLRQIIEAFLPPELAAHCDRFRRDFVRTAQ